jgi:major vault protein
MVELKLVYRVNFEGDDSKWFAVENYVKFLCDHVRSVHEGPHPEGQRSSSSTATRPTGPPGHNPGQGDRWWQARRDELPSRTG